MSQEVLKKFIIDLSKNKKLRDDFEANPHAVLEGLDLTDEEKQALQDAGRAGSALIEAQKKLIALQGGPPLGGDDAVVGTFLDKRDKEKKPVRKKPSVKKPAKKKPPKKKKAAKKKK